MLAWATCAFWLGNVHTVSGVLTPVVLTDAINILSSLRGQGKLGE
jgi:hypothetical protein